MRGMGAAEVVDIPGWVTLLRAPNAGPMTLDGTNTWIVAEPDSPLAVAQRHSADRCPCWT